MVKPLEHSLIDNVWHPAQRFLRKRAAPEVMARVEDHEELPVYNQMLRVRFLVRPEVRRQMR